MNRRARAALLAALGLAAGACSYDVRRLGPRDGALDVVHPFDAADSDPRDAPDASDVNVPPDTAPATCTNPNVLDAMGHTFGPSLVVTGTTVGGDSLLDPPTDDASCTIDYASSPSPEQVYRYTMQGTTGRLVATTDAPECDTAFDTIVYIRTTCDQASGTIVGCDDDDHVLDACPCVTGASCPSLQSTTVATGVAQGQSVYVVVDGYNMTTGNFQLTLTEGGALDAPPPPAGGGLNLVDRCACPSAMDLVTRDPIDFPTGADHFSGTATTLAVVGDTFGGSHATTLGHVSGVALDMQLTRNGLTDTLCPAGATAVVDVLLDGHVAQSFTVTADSRAPTPLRVAYQTFGALALSAGTVSVQLRLRSITAHCSGLVFANGGSSSLLLVGSTS